MDSQNFYEQEVYSLTNQHIAQCNETLLEITLQETHKTLVNKVCEECLKHEAYISCLKQEYESNLQESVIMLDEAHRVQNQSLFSEIAFVRSNFTLQSKEMQLCKLQEQKAHEKVALLQESLDTQTQKTQLAQENTLKIENDAKKQISSLQNVIEQNNQQMERLQEIIINTITLTNTQISELEKKLRELEKKETDRVQKKQKKLWNRLKQFFKRTVEKAFCGRSSFSKS